MRVSRFARRTTEKRETARQTARRLIEFWRKRECHNAREMPLTEVSVNLRLRLKTTKIRKPESHVTQWLLAQTGPKQTWR